MRSRSLALSSLLVVAGSLLPSVALAQAVIPPDASIGAPLDGAGAGFCARFVKANALSNLDSIDDALNLLNGSFGLPDEALGGNGISDGRAVVPFADLFDGGGATTPGFLPYNVLFPWSNPDNAITAGQCTAHQPLLGTFPADQFAVRLTGVLTIKTAGTKTFLVRSDDGYRMVIGGKTVSVKDGPRGALTDTARASFAQPGRYPIEIVYYEQDGVAALEAMMAEGDVRFVDNTGAAVAAAGTGVDLGDSSLAAPPAAFFPLSYQLVAVPAGETTCLTLAGQSSDLCVLSPADTAITCGNGMVDQLGGNTTEACDDGNKTAGDGCSPTCTVETSFLCSGVPSVCVSNTGGAGGASGAAGAAGAGAGGA
ncbi:MAG: hypothetical protein EOO75_15760, partial [Myxococcales bacterium]